MNTFFTLLKEGLKRILAYLSKEKVKEAFSKAFIAFKEILWKELKKDVYEQTLITIEAAKRYYQQEQVQIKKEELISQIVDKIKLPILLRPFKKLLKNYINKKVENLILDVLQKSHDFLIE